MKSGAVPAMPAPPDWKESGRNIRDGEKQQAGARAERDPMRIAHQHRSGFAVGIGGRETASVG